MNCEKCGKPIPENINYCPSCSLTENPNYIKYMEEKKNKENIALKNETIKSNSNVNKPISASTQQPDTTENVSNETNNLNDVLLAGVTSNQVNNNLNNQELQLEIIQSVPEVNSISSIPTITSNEPQQTLPLQKHSSKSNNNKKLIIVIIITALILSVGGYFVGIFLNNNEANNTNNNSNKDNENSSINSKGKEFAKMTKKDAIDHLRKMVQNNIFVPNGFVNSDIILQTGEVHLELLYSYDNFDDVQDIAIDSVFGSVNGFKGLFGTEAKTSIDKLNIKQVEDRYAITYVDTSIVNCDDKCYRGISFNKNYLDYYEEVIEHSNYTSHNDKLVFKNFETSFVKEAMSIFLYSQLSGVSNIYDYMFEEIDNKYVMTFYTIGIGLDMNNLDNMTADNIQYAINLIEREISLDKNTGELQWRFESEENRNRVLKSLPITTEEAEEIMMIKAS